jgi:heptosyltransferase I
LAAVDVPVVPDMTLHVNPEQREWWRSQRAAEGWPRGKYAVLACTSRWLSKRWPIDRWVQLVVPLLERGFERLVVIGSPSEQEQVRQLFVQHKPGVRGMVDLVGKTNIAQTMAVIAEADLVIANDSAPLHMAVGFNRNIVALFGPTDPAEVGPYGRDDSVIRGYCPSVGEKINFKNSKLGDSLMRFISTAAVLQKIDQVMAGAAGRGAAWTPKLVPGDPIPEALPDLRPRREATS